jgi:hypothetical protein
MEEPMKTFNWIVIFGLLAAIPMAERTQASTTDAAALPGAGRGMDVVVAIGTRSASRPDAAALAVATAADSPVEAPVAADRPALRLDVGIPGHSELLARVRDTAREAIENLELSFEQSDEPF